MLSGIAPAATKASQTDPDEIPAPPDEATTKRGDLWILGDHRLLCGDAGSVADLDRLLDGTNVALLATDPPYNVRVEPGRNNAIAAGLSSFRPSVIHHQAIMWVKEHPVLTRKDFMGDHEWCFYGWREGAAHRFFGPANVPDVWSVKKVNPNAMVHLTEKPVELARLAIEYSSLPGDAVLDLFAGSGRHSSPPSRPDGAASAWSSTRSIATSSSPAGRRSLAPGLSASPGAETA